MSLTKKHYEEIARILKKHSSANYCSFGVLAEDLADYFLQDNPRFDKKKFFEACGRYRR